MNSRKTENARVFVVSTRQRSTHTARAFLFRVDAAAVDQSCSFGATHRSGFVSCKISRMAWQSAGEGSRERLATVAG